MQKLILFHLFLAICVLSHAQILQTQNARSFALSGAMLAVPDPGSGNSNAGALAAYAGSGIELNYHNRYMLPDLGTQSLVLNFKAGKGIVSPRLGYFGIAEFNQTSLSLAYGHQLTRWFYAGINFSGTSQAVQATGERSFGMAGDIGLFAKFENGFACGTNFSFPGKSYSQNEDAGNRNFFLRLGVAYSAENKFTLASQFNWLETNEYSIAGATEFFPVSFLALRAGFKLQNASSYSWGLGIIQKRWILNIGFEQHQVLGLSGSISVLIKFGLDES